MRKIDVAGLGAVLAVTAAGYFVGLEPILARQAEFRASQAQLDTQRQAAQAAERSLADIRRQVSLAEQTVAENPLRLEPLHHLNRRLTDVAMIASRHGLQIDQLEPGRPTVSDHYVTVPIRVTGESTYGGATRFLHDLRTSMPDIAVAVVELSGEPRSRQKPAKFTVALLWHAAPDAATTAADAAG